MSHPITERGLKIAATKTGCTPDEYLAHLNADEAWCSGHGAWEPRSAFKAGPSWRGLQAQCVQARRDYDRERDRNGGRIYHAGPAYSRGAS